MESEVSFKTNLNTVKEMILDEEKIVTYISLSKDLCIHINISKKLLECIVKKILEEYPNLKLNVNYILSGISNDNKARTIICTENELNNLKITLKNILYEHVYSVSKGSPSIDRAAYLLLIKFDDFNLCPGLIKNSECYKRTYDEIGSLKSNSQPAVLIESKAIPLDIIKSESKVLSNFTKNSQLEEKKTIDDISEKIKSKIKCEGVSPTKPINNKHSIKTNNLKTQKGIAGFLSKCTTTGNKKVLKEPEHQTKTTLKESVKEEKKEVENKNLKSESEVKNETKSIMKTTDVNQIKKKSRIDKKRKRVLHVSDSDSEAENDPFADKQEIIKNESDDEIPPTPSVNSIKITSGIVNPKKRRKVVDKTYSEDGYIITKKEEVYESCSENEDVKIKQNMKEVRHEKMEISPKDKQIAPKSIIKKISPPQKGKQATLAHFFKKI